MQDVQEVQVKVQSTEDKVSADAGRVGDSGLSVGAAATTVVVVARFLLV